MKKMKVIAMMVCITMLTCATSCSDDTMGHSNSLAGTTWTAPYVDNLMVLKFTSNTQCEAYFADNNMNYQNGATQGTYSITGNNVTFNGIHLVRVGAHYLLHTGVVSGNFMTTTGEEYYSNSTGEGTHRTWNETWNKR